MACEQQSLKTEIRNLRLPIGLRNRKQKNTLTFLFDNGLSFDQNQPIRTSLPESNRSIRNKVKYHCPPKRIRVSYDLSSNHSNNDSNSHCELFSDVSCNFTIGIVKKVATSHITSQIATGMLTVFKPLSVIKCLIGPAVVFFGSKFNLTRLFNIPFAYAQTVNDTLSWDNYTVIQGPWGDPLYDHCSYPGTIPPEPSAPEVTEYPWCNQFLIYDQNGNLAFSSISYIGIQENIWDNVAAELNPPAYCQEIFQKCRSVPAIIEHVKTVFAQNDPTLLGSVPCMDQRSVPENLCPSTTVFGSLSPEGCYFIKGCNSTTDSSIFTKCIEENLQNVTLDANNTVNYYPDFISTDCTIVEPDPYIPPYIPPDIPTPSSSTLPPTVDPSIASTAQDLITSSSVECCECCSNPLWFLILLVPCAIFVGCKCGDRIEDKRKKEAIVAARKISIENEIQANEKETHTQIYICRELLGLRWAQAEKILNEDEVEKILNGNEATKSSKEHNANNMFNEDISVITLSYLFEHEFSKNLLNIAKESFGLIKEPPPLVDESANQRIEMTEVLLDIDMTKKSYVSV